MSSTPTSPAITRVDGDLGTVKTRHQRSGSTPHTPNIREKRKTGSNTITSNILVKKEKERPRTVSPEEFKSSLCLDLLNGEKVTDNNSPDTSPSPSPSPSRSVSFPKSSSKNDLQSDGLSLDSAENKDADQE